MDATICDMVSDVVVKSITADPVPDGVAFENIVVDVISGFFFVTADVIFDRGLCIVYWQIYRFRSSSSSFGKPSLMQ